MASLLIEPSSRAPASAKENEESSPVALENQCVSAAKELGPPQKNTLAELPDWTAPSITSESSTVPTQTLRAGSACPLLGLLAQLTLARAHTVQPRSHKPASALGNLHSHWPKADPTAQSILDSSDLA